MTGDERRHPVAGGHLRAAHAGPVPGAAGVHAGGARYPGGDDPALIGLAMGIYGLTQAVMQVPLGLASDRIGRKKVIVAGLLVFALGSAVAALAPACTC
jgi:MFS family permease